MIKTVAFDAAFVMEHEDMLWEALSWISDLCERFSGEDTGVGLAKEIIDALHMQYPTTLIWAVIDEGDDYADMRAYSVASIRQRGRKRWVEITQLAGFGSGAPEVGSEMIAGFKEIEKWGASFGASEVRLATFCDGGRGVFASSRARLFEKMYGFKPHRLLMSKPIEIEESTNV